jgi:hypothetical protein
MEAQAANNNDFIGVNCFGYAKVTYFHGESITAVVQNGMISVLMG